MRWRRIWLVRTMAKTSKPLRLQDVRPTPERVAKLQQRALMRLQLRVVGEIHRIYGEFGEWLRGAVTGVADDEGLVSESAIQALMPTIEQRWQAAHRSFVALLTKAREQAADIPFGSLVIWHNSYVRPLDESLEERLIGADEVGALIRMWISRRDRALALAADHLWSDGFTLSARIWRLQNDGIEPIRSVLHAAMSERTNALDLARQLEPLLGASQDCPRWTVTRLYRMTPAERAGARRGLVSGGDCAGQGVAYKALRLARNEIQVAHHRMSDEIAQHSPWIEQEEIVLSPQHPETDICDKVVEGNPYAVGEVTLPIHPQCLCGKRHVMADRKQFVSDVRGWLRGENSYLDDYAEWTGNQQPTDQLPWTLSLADSMELWLNTARDGHAEALGL